MIGTINNRISSVNTPDQLNEESNNIFIETQRHFLNNRIGQYVREIEKDQLVKDNFTYRRGDIVAEVVTGPHAVHAGTNVSDSYKWSLYLGLDNTTSPPQHKIYTTESIYDGNNIKYNTKLVNIGTIYRSYTPIEQNYKPNQKIVEEDILETYTI